MAGTKNKASDLNNILFEQMERLNDMAVKGENLAEEINRSRAMCDVSDKIIKNASLALEAEKVRLEYGCIKNPTPNFPAYLEVKDGQ